MANCAALITDPTSRRNPPQKRQCRNEVRKGKKFCYLHGVKAKETAAFRRGRGELAGFKLERFDDNTWRYGSRLFTAGELDSLFAQWKRERGPGADLTRGDMQEIATEMIRTRSYRWCRARTYHALAGAYLQGRLAEVLDEILDDAGWDRIREARDASELTDNLVQEIGVKLAVHGWITEREFDHAG